PSTPLNTRSNTYGGGPDTLPILHRAFGASDHEAVSIGSGVRASLRSPHAMAEGTTSSRAAALGSARSGQRVGVIVGMVEDERWYEGPRRARGAPPHRSSRR